MPRKVASRDVYCESAATALRMAKETSYPHHRASDGHCHVYLLGDPTL